MDTELFELPIFNDNLDNAFDKEDSESLNDSIFLPAQFEEIAQIEESSPNKPKPTRRTERRQKRDERQARQTRKDDFDYNAYIQEEMKNYDTGAMPENLRKHMIQKIRNRMSAQRSRLRQKSIQETMERENSVLKEINRDLRTEIAMLRAENERLRKKLSSAEVSEGTSVDEKAHSEESVFTREKSTKSPSLLTKPMMFIALAIACAFMVPGNSPVDNPAVRMGGVVPMLASAPATGKQLKTIETICSDYCKRSRVLCDKEVEKEAALAYLRQLNKLSATPTPNNERQIELFDKVNAQKLICFDPESPVETENVFRVIVEGRSQGRLDTHQVYLGQFEKLEAE